MQRLITWNNGILEDWNNGSKIMKSFLIQREKQKLIRLRRAVLKPQYSFFPSFHWTSQGKFHPLRGEIKAGRSGLGLLLDATLA
jgi:hypothetical protein